MCNKSKAGNGGQPFGPFKYSVTTCCSSCGAICGFAVGRGSSAGPKPTTMAEHTKAQSCLLPRLRA